MVLFSSQLETTDSVLHDIMEKAGATGQVKIVDLTSSESPSITPQTTKTITPKHTPKLPAGLALFQTKCTQKHKDSYTYAYLTTTKRGSSGPAIVFCNSIAGVKRVGSTLETLGLPTKMLHAEMNQVRPLLVTTPLLSCDE